MNDEKAASAIEADAVPEAEAVEEVVATHGFAEKAEADAAWAEIAEHDPESVPPDPGPPTKKRRTRKQAKPHALAGKVVKGGGYAYYLVDERGKRRLIPSVQHFYRMGLQPVIRLTNEELEAMPEGWPLR